MKRNFSIALVIGVLFIAPCSAQDPPNQTETNLRLTLSDSFSNAPGSWIVAGRYGEFWGVRLGAWLNASHVESGKSPHMFAGVDYLWRFQRWRFGLGAVWFEDVNRINGTHWNFELALAYDFSDRFFVEYLHMSHGSALGIKQDEANRGWNFIGLGVAL